MTTDRRLHDMDLGRRDHTRWLGSSGRYSTQGFAYSDIPNQLLRINSLEGSLAFSGAVLTGVTDVSPVAGTVNVTGSPVYTATDSGLNNAPSFTPVIATANIVTPNVDRSQVRFIACVVYRPSGGVHYFFDGDDASGRIYAITSGANLVTNTKTFAIPEGSSVGRKRLLFPVDGVTACLWNGSSLGTWPVGSPTGSGLSIGTNNVNNQQPTRVAFFMLCSSVPSAPLLAALEAKLLTDFG